MFWFTVAKFGSGEPEILLYLVIYSHDIRYVWVLGVEICYGLCVMRESWVMACKRTWETQKAMGYKGVWVIWGMCYEGVDCSHIM